MRKLSETVDFIMSFLSRHVTVCTVLNWLKHNVPFVSVRVVALTFSRVAC